MTDDQGRHAGRYRAVDELVEPVELLCSERSCALVEDDDTTPGFDVLKCSSYRNGGAFRDR